MRMRAKILILCLTLFTANAVAFVWVVPLLEAGVSVAGPRIVAAIAARAAARQALSATVTAVRSAALKKAMNARVAQLVTGSANPTRLQSILGVASWASVGSMLTDTLDSYFLGDSGSTELIPASEGNSMVAPYKLTVAAGSGGSAPYLYGNNALSLFHAGYRYRAANGLLPCSASAGCTYSDAIAVTAQSESTANGTVTFTGRYQVTVPTTSGGSKTSDASLSLTVRTNAGYDAASTDVGTDVMTVAALQEQELDYKKMADVINSLAADAVATPDYEGLQVTQADYATAEDVKTAFQEAGVTSPTQAAWASPWKDLDATVQTGTETGTQPGTTTPETGTEVSYENPGITEPTLETPPTGLQILTPILSMFDSNRFNMSAISASCPVWSFTVFEREITIDSHCGLLEKIHGIISALMLVLYGFCAWRIVMSA